MLSNVLDGKQSHRSAWPITVYLFWYQGYSSEMNPRAWLNLMTNLSLIFFFLEHPCSCDPDITSIIFFCTDNLVNNKKCECIKNLSSFKSVWYLYNWSKFHVFNIYKLSYHNLLNTGIEMHTAHSTNKSKGENYQTHSK